MIAVVAIRELLGAARSRFALWTRWAVAVWLAFWVFVSFFSEVTPDGIPLPAVGATSRGLVTTIVWQLLIAVFLAGPAFTAGAITDEKTRGTLELLLLTHVGPTSIILGKLLARIVQGFVWSLAAWPLLAVIGRPGGVTPAFFGCLAVVTILLLAGTCGVTLMTSVWARNTRAAVVNTYFNFAILINLYAMSEAGLFGKFKLPSFFVVNPFQVLDAARDQPDYGILWSRLIRFAIVWGGLAIVTTLIAISRLRPEALKQQQNLPPMLRQGRMLPAPPIADRPVAWAELYTGRSMGKIVGVVVVASLTLAIYGGLLTSTALAGSREYLELLFLVAVILCGLGAGARASACIISERDRKTWEPVLTSPMTLPQIVREKCEGIVASTWPFLFAFLLPASFALSIHGLIENGEDRVMFGVWGICFSVSAMVFLVMVQRYGREWAPFGMALVAASAALYSGMFAILVLLTPLLTYALMYYMAGFGIWFSARSKNAWLSMLGTVIAGSLSMFVVVLAGTPLGCMSCCMSGLMVSAISSTAGTMTGLPDNVFVVIFLAVTCSFGFFWLGRRMMEAAGTYLSRHDRIAEGFQRLADLDLPKHDNP